VRYFDAADVAALGAGAAVDAIRSALLGGLDPALDAPRLPVDLSTGQFLLMPSETPPSTGTASGGPGSAGVKVVTVAPGNPGHGLPRIQALYLLFDQPTLSLRGILDGTALTSLRTPAVSVAAVLDHLPERGLRVVVVGSGPQAIGHVAALAAVRTIETLHYLVRDPGRAPFTALALRSADAAEALRDADVVVCATSARAPVFDSSLLPDTVIVIAVGSHEPDARELDAALLGRSTVIVEDVTTALREAGDIVMAIGEGVITSADLVSMRDVVVAPGLVTTERPIVFKSVGMSWQDLTVADAVVRHAEPG
jgi:ornithine cyclodeaminase